MAPRSSHPLALGSPRRLEWICEKQQRAVASLTTAAGRLAPGEVLREATYRDMAAHDPELATVGFVRGAFAGSDWVGVLSAAALPTEALEREHALRAAEDQERLRATVNAHREYWGGTFAGAARNTGIRPTALRGRFRAAGLPEREGDGAEPWEQAMRDYCLEVIAAAALAYKHQEKALTEDDYQWLRRRAPRPWPRVEVLTELLRCGSWDEIRHHGEARLRGDETRVRSFGVPTV